jgi:hypothetical protein
MALLTGFYMLLVASTLFGHFHLPVRGLLPRLSKPVS